MNPGDAGERILRTKPTGQLKPGDAIRHAQAGGGGWGDPLERDPQIVARDVLNEKVSIAGARRYGVVIDSATLQVDTAGTEALRSELRKARD
jgi:N-methylhydantoinase B